MAAPVDAEQQTFTPDATGYVEFPPFTDVDTLVAQDPVVRVGDELQASTDKASMLQIPGEVHLLYGRLIQTFRGVTGDLNILTGAGGDIISVDHLNLAGNLNIQSGPDVDILHFGISGSVSTWRDVSINLGAGDDSMDVMRVYAAGNISIDAAAGDDTVSLGIIPS